MGNKYQLGLYEKAMPNYLSLLEKLKLAKQSGYDFLEISVDETDEKLARLDYSKEQINEIKNWMMEADFPIYTMCLSGHRKYPLGSLDDEVIKRSLEIMEKAIILASRLGVRIIQIAGYDEYYNESNEETKKRFLVNLKKSVEIASKYSVILAFETMETDFINTIQKAMYYVNVVDSPYLAVYPDLGNITNASKIYKTSVLDDIRLGKGRIAACHIKDTVPNVYRDLNLGDGHVDFENDLLALYQQGVRMYVTEYWYQNDETYIDNINKNIKFVRDIFAKIED